MDAADPPYDVSILEALWSAEFVSPVPDLPAGIVIIEAGRIVGGDGRYFYCGTYELGADVLMAEAKVTHYAGPTRSVFGPHKNFDLYLSGVPGRDRFTVSGESPQNPGVFIEWRFIRRAELP